jgi:hypothetical protein
MKKRMIFTTSVLLLFIGVSLITSCSRMLGPSNSEIKEIFQTRLLGKELPSSWGKTSFLGTKILSIDEVEVKERGNYNKGGNYYPIKVRLAGTAELNLLTEKKKEKFDKDLNFQFFKDDYGKWRARYFDSFEGVSTY